MSDASSHEADHVSGHGTHGHVPIDPNDRVVRATPPAPATFAIGAVAVVLTLLALALLVAGQGA